MMNSESLGFQRWLVAAVMVIVAGVCLIRIWLIYPLYASDGVATAAQVALETVSAERGWLLSDVEIRDVHPERMIILYRPHLRGRDPSACFILSLVSSSLTPCSAAR